MWRSAGSSAHSEVVADRWGQASVSTAPVGSPATEGLPQVRQVFGDLLILRCSLRDALAGMEHGCVVAATEGVPHCGERCARQLAGQVDRDLTWPQNADGPA